VQQGNRSTGRLIPRSEARDVTRSRKIRDEVRWLLWGRAAGRCEFRDCNEQLWKSKVTQDIRNLGEAAHIYAFSAAGPRGGGDLAAANLNDLDNLMLVCTACHTTIDRGDGPIRYSASLLRQMKRAHEDRIELATSVSPRARSHVLVYGPNVGAHSPLPTFEDAREALFPTWFPASRANIELSMRNSAARDSESDFWLHERTQLQRQFQARVRERIVDGEISHLSVFAIAPQPLLIELGCLLGDITNTAVYQRHREPQSWRWPVDKISSAFEIKRPKSIGGAPALVFSLSATITDDRVSRVLGKDATIWHLTTKSPNRDLVTDALMLEWFRRDSRLLIDELKATHGDRTPLNVFPAMPVSLAVELGRIRMPKADVPWRLYDENQATGGFQFAFSLEG
jgi:hypothetical protein